MYVIATFEHSLNLESAICELENSGINPHKILALPLKKSGEEKKIFDSIHYADGISLLDGAFILGSAFMVIGTIYGFNLKWGPIIWGLIGLLFGGIVGFLMDYFIGWFRRRPKKSLPKRLIPTEVILIINSPEEKVELIERTLWNYKALGIARFGGNNQS